MSISYVNEENKVYTTPENNGGQGDDTVKNYMRFTALEGGTVSAHFIMGEDSDSTSPNVSYSYDGIVWQPWDFNELILNTGQSLYLKGYNENGFPHPLKFYLYEIVDEEWGDTISEGKFSVSGNIMSLLYGDDFENNTTLPIEYCFYGMFSETDKLIDASNLILPATTLTNSCYYSMFNYCTSLTTAPELPATRLAKSCYYEMFYGCTSLTTAPELPATTLAENCYLLMFGNCTNLTTAPELPATTLAEQCYLSMFTDCTNLTTAPELPATTLANYCYSSMFANCTNLTTAPELPATTLAKGCYNSMFCNCTSLTTAPELPANTLAERCYESMFDSCTSLNHITMLATDISASNCLSGWVYNVSSTGTFVKHPNMTSLKTGTSGIPRNWTVEDAVL